jgi:DNA invertase Pin-like site-specific DNA recombinase
MAQVGYARVSSTGQSLDVQLDKLKQCEKIYSEKITGTTDKRPQLKACLDYVREGDTLVITRLDRLARSTLHLCQIADLLSSKNVALVVIDQSIDTSSATGTLMFNMLASIAEFETELRKERQAEGIAKARANGIHFGRESTLTDKQILELREKRASGEKIKDLMSHYELSKASIYRYLKEDN